MSENITVIGAGTMGAGIAQVAAIHGYRTTLCDVSKEQLASAVGAIEASVEKGIARGKTPEEARERVQSGLTTESDLQLACQGATVVIEAVPEDLALKQSIFQKVESVIADDALLASNTSSIPISKLAADLKSPDRFVGMHFFNPVPIMALIEVIRGESTSDTAIDRTVDLAHRLSKEPIVVKDSPGFATSRLGLVIGLEAIRMLEDGVASAVEIDKAMELGYRHPMGPLKLTDLVGLDVRLAIAEVLHEQIGEQFRPPQLLRDMVEKGHLGKKTGQGFHDWSA